MGDEERFAAMVEFIGTFPTLSGNPPDSMDDLSDGVALFEVLSEIAPDHFDPTTIARHLGDNWALKSSNLRKLVRNLEWYYHEDLKKDANFTELTSEVGNIARSGDPVGIAALIELIAAAAVTCELKGEFVGRILAMPPEHQLQMKRIIEAGMSRLQNYDGDDDDGDDNEVIFGMTTGEEKGEEEEALLFEDNYLKLPDTDDTDKEELETQLMETRRELAQQRSQVGEIREDAEKAQSKLRALIDDLQDRLASRQDDLIKAEEELRSVTTDLDEAKNKIHDLEEQKAQLEDELDVASAKATQLHKAEATVFAYKKKLETVGVMNQQMTDLEDQAAGYLRQIMDLEAEVKKTQALQKQVDTLQVRLASMENERSEKSDSLQNTATEIAELKSLLAAAEKAKKMFQSELTELRAQQAVEDVPAVQGLDTQAPQMTAKQKEQMVRLEYENKKLKEELGAMKKADASAAAAAAAAAAVPVDTGDATKLAEEVTRLKQLLAKKEAENKKIGSDKNKLEAYTKRTLAKFQDKYLVALQECKAKLKEKQDKIEILESRSATEKTAQKREERLLSSTIYELGLAIMQNRLKER